MWCLELVLHRVAPGFSMILTNKVLAFLGVCLSFFTLDPHPPFPSENGFEEKTSLHTQNQTFLKTLMWIKKVLISFPPQLVLNEKSGIFRSNKTSTVHSGEGPVRNIKWKGEFLAWANNIVSFVSWRWT